MPNWMTWMANRYSYTRLAANVGIPSSHIKKYATGALRIPAGRYKTLRAFYQKVQYRQLRQTGFSPFEAKRYSTHSVASKDVMIGKLRFAAEKIGSREGINPNNILAGFSKSRRTIEDLLKGADAGWS